jgi:hypothetical protein
VAKAAARAAIGRAATKAATGRAAVSKRASPFLSGDPVATASARHSVRATTVTRTFLRDNGLSIVVLTLFVVFLMGQALAGWQEFNDEQLEHGETPVSLAEYVAGDHFAEATAENWESEFLQMAFYVLLTTFLFQKGSSESKKIGEQEAVDRDPRLTKNKKDAPWPVRRGGWVLVLYEYSLTLAFLLLFAVSFIWHAIGGARDYSQEQLEHGGDPVSVAEYVTTSRFWFESFQNWQSEFLALGAMAVLSIWLRQRWSPESKPVDAPHSHTGSE